MYSFDAHIIASFLPHKTEKLVKQHIAYCRRKDFNGLMSGGNGKYDDDDDNDQTL